MIELSIKAKRKNYKTDRLHEVYITCIGRANKTTLIGCLHDRANIELAQAGLLEFRPLAEM